MSNWDSLFGTPERAAETLQRICDTDYSCNLCTQMVVEGVSVGWKTCPAGNFLVWLQQDAEDKEFTCADCEIDYNDKEDDE